MKFQAIYRTGIAVLIATLIITCGIFVYRHFRNTSLCSDLSCVNFPGKTRFSLKEMYIDTPLTYRALYTDTSTYLRIEVNHVTGHSAREETDAQVARMKALFEKAPAPYPGDISDAITCDDKHIPSYTKEGNLQYFIGYLNNRMTFGSCSDSDIVYRGIDALFSCTDTNQAVRIEFIEPLASFNKDETQLIQTVRNMTCAKR